jgi:protein-S-isoprenylcysteine O-methyltransferase Ste14
VINIIPTHFELGFFNAWIFVVMYFVLSIIPSYTILFVKGEYKSGSKKLMNISPVDAAYDNYEKAISYLLFLMFILFIIITIFLPINFNTFWFYIGLAIYLIGIVIVSMVIHSFATNPSEKPITTGIYRYSRNPMYLSMFISYIGIGIITMSWIFFFLTVIYIIICAFQVQTEEKHCLKKFGISYRKYMDNTSRWIGRFKV